MLMRNPFVILLMVLLLHSYEQCSQNLFVKGTRNNNNNNDKEETQGCDLEKLQRWLEVEKGGYVSPDLVLRQTEESGISVWITREGYENRIKAMKGKEDPIIKQQQTNPQPLLSIPLSAMFTLNDARQSILKAIKESKHTEFPPESEEEWKDLFTEHSTVMAIGLLLELNNQKQSSQWQDYLRCLPSMMNDNPPRMSHPTLWDNKFQQSLQSTQSLWYSERKSQLLDQSFDEFEQFIKWFNLTQLLDFVDHPTWIWHSVLITSRMFNVKVRGESIPSLVPFGDMFNIDTHVGRESYFSSLSSSSSNRRATVKSFTNGDKTAFVFALKTVDDHSDHSDDATVGDEMMVELFAEYGSDHGGIPPNYILLNEYGFALLNNPSDCVYLLTADDLEFGGHKRMSKLGLSKPSLGAIADLIDTWGLGGICVYNMMSMDDDIYHNNQKNNEWTLDIAGHNLSGKMIQVSESALRLFVYGVIDRSMWLFREDKATLRHFIQHLAAYLTGIDDEMLDSSEHVSELELAQERWLKGVQSGKYDQIVSEEEMSQVLSIQVVKTNILLYRVIQTIQSFKRVHPQIILSAISDVRRLVRKSLSNNPWSLISDFVMLDSLQSNMNRDALNVRITEHLIYLDIFRQMRQLQEIVTAMTTLLAV